MPEGDTILRAARALGRARVISLGLWYATAVERIEVLRLSGRRSVLGPGIAINRTPAISEPW